MGRINKRQNAQQWLEYTPENIVVYTANPKQYLGLRYCGLCDPPCSKPSLAASETSLSKSASFSFLAFPYEIRLLIYESLLLHHAPIELWPHIEYVSRPCINKARNQSFRNYSRWTSTILPLLRVCSQVHEEASKVFYGKNEFRFSGVNGWMVCSAFLETITSRHWRYLRHLSLHVPFRGWDIAYSLIPSLMADKRETTCSGPNSKQWRHFRKYLIRKGLQIPCGWDYRTSVLDCYFRLWDADLMVFQLFQPFTFCLLGCNENEKYLGHIKALKDAVDEVKGRQRRKGLKVNMIFARIPEEYFEGHLGLPMVKKSYYCDISWFKLKKQTLNLEVGLMYADFNMAGDYHVIE